jgi:glycosyltransferase involved in cell wall biosynthesis
MQENSYKKNEGGLRTQGIFKRNSLEQTLITIITVVFNGEKYLEETILSVLNQTFDNIEYIIVDGGSTDSTIDIINKYNDAIDYWISEPDKGIYDAMNKGISLCSGTIIGLINAGDTYTKDAIKTIAKEHNNNPLGIIAGDCKVMLNQANKWLIRKGQIGNLPYNTLPHPSVFVPLAIYKKHGLFDINFKIAGDYDFLCRCYQNQVKFSYVSEVIAIFSPPGLSSDYYLAETESLKIRLRYDLPFLRSVSISAVSFLTITAHKVLIFLDLWRFIEAWRHGSIR